MATPQGRLLLVALLLLLGIGDELLLFLLQGRASALQLVHHDTSGEAFAAAPDPRFVARAPGFHFDYGMGMDADRAARLGAPPGTGGDGGLEDLRHDIRWVRDRLRAGEGFATNRWRLEDAVAAAADTGRRFLCLSYACAMVSLAESQGYPGRVVHLGRHITSEVYLPARGRWVMADALYDVIPHDPGGDPLSLLDTHRRLESGAAVEWRPVHGVRGDDDSLDVATQAIIESLIRAGEFRVTDGALTFALRSDAERLLDVLTGRTRVLQLALHGEPPIDGVERRLRAALVAWNLLGLAALAAVWALSRRARRAAAG